MPGKLTTPTATIGLLIAGCGYWHHLHVFNNLYRKSIVVKYIVRLDDFCPTNDPEKWAPFFLLFDRFNIKPIIAVIPANKDPKLIGNIEPDNNFWSKVRNLVDKGYAVAMHGYEHRYVTTKSGILKINKRSEFAGLTYREQEFKIKKAFEVFAKEKIPAFCFVAPAHSFDYKTLKALKRRTDIKIISDGLLDKPYKRFGFNWIPAQLPDAVEKRSGTWTFNYHPETCSQEKLATLTNFISKYHRKFVDPKSLMYQNYTWMDSVLERYLILLKLTTCILKRLIGR